QRGRPMTRLFVPRDAGALAVGADEVAKALAAAGERRREPIEIVRTGSRGLYWLEPMIEVETPTSRIAYGPVAPEDVGSLLDAGLLPGGAPSPRLTLAGSFRRLLGTDPHPLRLGPVEEIPWLKRQTRLTFARCGVVDPRSLADYRAHGGYRGL